MHPVIFCFQQSTRSVQHLEEKLCSFQCMCACVHSLVPWRTDDPFQFVLRHKLPNFMKYQITNWPRVRFPTWKWDCNIWASIRITGRATLSCLLLSWQVFHDHEGQKSSKQRIASLLKYLLYDIFFTGHAWPLEWNSLLTCKSAVRGQMAWSAERSSA